MTKKQRLLLGGVVVVVIFFATTFSKNWGTAVSENLLEKYKPEVKALKSDKSLASAKCPMIIKKLERGLPELAKSQDKTQVPQAKKLIADCAFASGQYDKSVEFYKQLSRFEPNVARWHALVAESYLKMRKPGDALKPSILATQLDPNDFGNRLLNARVLVSLKLRNRAVDAYTQAIKVAPYDQIEPTKKELARFLEADSDEEDADSSSEVE